MTGPAASPSPLPIEHPRSQRCDQTLSGWPGAAAVAVLLLVLTIAALGPTLWSRERVFSNVERDLALQFIHWRKFGFDQLRAGHLALWNPHIYGGAPFFGGFQSALLYPPNWFYLCLPLGVAINTGIALHVFLTGIGMFLWMRVRGLRPSAGIFAGMLLMFSGPVFPHIYAGHLSNLCTMAWGPLIFLAIDGWLSRRTTGWLLLGSASVAMQILAGHPQYVFYTGVAAALYCATRLAVAKDRVRAACGLAVIPLVAIALSAVQMAEGMHAAGESIRNHGTAPEFAGLFSFPPENLLTVFVPNFFGDLTTHAYWGRWLFWEMSLFFGVTGMTMAVYALASGPRFKAWSCLLIAAVLLLLAMGSYTPLFTPLYLHAPGFDRFRGWSKFIYPAVMMMIVVAATGLDSLLRSGVPDRRPAWIVFAAALVLFACSLWARGTAHAAPAVASQPWHFWMRTLSETNDQYLSREQVDNADFVEKGARQASRQLRYTGFTFLALAAVLGAAYRDPRAILVIPVLAAVEMLCFARSTLDSFPIRDALSPPEASVFATSTMSGTRVNDERSHNLGMSLGTNDLWGYDPGVLRRYAEWMAASQDRDPDAVSESMKFTHDPAAFASLLRCQFYVAPLEATKNVPSPEVKTSAVAPAARFLLVSQARVIAQRDEELDEVFSDDFNPAQTVLLESAPVPAPAGILPAGRVKLLEELTDSLTIEADMEAPAILLITDTYSDGWKARSLLPTGQTGSGQNRYDVMPADYCLRAIPLSKGHHKLLLEYRPTAFVIGKWVSLVSVALYTALLIAWFVARQRRILIGQASGSV